MIRNAYCVLRKLQYEVRGTKYEVLGEEHWNVGATRWVALVLEGTIGLQACRYDGSQNPNTEYTENA
jgi:hypothetical protein